MVKKDPGLLDGAEDSWSSDLAAFVDDGFLLIPLSPPAHRKGVVHAGRTEATTARGYPGWFLGCMDLPPGYLAEAAATALPSNTEVWFLSSGRNEKRKSA